MDQPRKWMALKRVTDTQPLLSHDAATSRRAKEVFFECLGVRICKTALGADLGGCTAMSRRAWEISHKNTGVPHTQALPRILTGKFFNQDVDNVRKGIRQCRWKLREALSFLVNNLFSLKSDCLAMGVNRLVKHLVIRGARCASNCP